MHWQARDCLQIQPLPNAGRYGTVELTGVKAEAPGGWAWGRRLSINARRWLVWGHMAAINGVSIGGARLGLLLP